MRNILKFLKLMKPSAIEQDLRIGLYNAALNKIDAGYTPTEAERIRLDDLIIAEILKGNATVLPYVDANPTARMVLAVIHCKHPEAAQALDRNINRALPEILSICSSRDIDINCDILSYPSTGQRKVGEKASELEYYMIMNKDLLSIIDPQNYRLCLESLQVMIDKFNKIYPKQYFTHNSFKELKYIYDDLVNMHAIIRQQIDEPTIIKPLIKSTITEDFAQELSKLEEKVNVLMESSIGEEKKALIKDKMMIGIPKMLDHYASFPKAERRTIKNDEGRTPYDIVATEIKELLSEVEFLTKLTTKDKFKNLEIESRYLKVGR